MPDIRHAVNGAAAALVALILSAVPAAASGEIACTAMDGSDASIDIAVSHLPFLVVLRATATDGAEVWSTQGIDDARPMIMGQGFMDDRQVLVDFTDSNGEGIVVSLRLVQMESDKSYAEAGVLSFENGSVFPVQCING